MTWMILLGIMALVFGMLLLASHGSLTRMSEDLNKGFYAYMLGFS